MRNKDIVRCLLYLDMKIELNNEIERISLMAAFIWFKFSEGALHRLGANASHHQQRILLQSRRCTPIAYLNFTLYSDGHFSRNNYSFLSFVKARCPLSSKRHILLCCRKQVMLLSLYQNNILYPEYTNKYSQGQS